MKAAYIVPVHSYEVEGIKKSALGDTLYVEWPCNGGSHRIRLNVEAGEVVSTTPILYKPKALVTVRLKMSGKSIRMVLRALGKYRAAAGIQLLPVDPEELQAWLSNKAVSDEERALTERWGRLTYLGPVDANRSIFGRSVLLKAKHEMYTAFLLRVAPPEMKDETGPVPKLRIEWVREVGSALLDNEFEMK
jgi:hypothetical protein